MAAVPWKRVPVVLLEWNELTADESSPSLLSKLGLAYGYDGLGILAVRGVPGFIDSREEALPKAYAFGNSPDAVKARYVDEESSYSFGWSHGKEKLEGRPDVAKGSYYNNPVHDAPFADDPAAVKQHPSFARPNVWPTDEDAPGFRDAYKRLAGVMVDAAGALARHVDAYVRSVEPLYPPAADLSLEAVVTRGRSHKARLLYYFPHPEAEVGALAGDFSAEAISSACGWHNDHSNLTALAPAQYYDATGRAIPCPDPAAGLFIRARNGDLVQVSMPSDCLAFQIGEASQIHSGGVLQATPHCVRAAAAPGVSRATMAVFMGPHWTQAMACPGLQEGDRKPTSVDADASSKAATWARVLKGARGELLPRGVPTLESRWDGPSQTFGGFTDKTLGSYY